MPIEAGEPSLRVITTNDDLCRFLLPNSHNARILGGSDLNWELNIVGVSGCGTQESWQLKSLKKQIAEKVRKVAEIHKLGRNESDILTHLYSGFTQSLLYEDGQEFAVKIVAAEKTEIKDDEEFPDSPPVEGAEYASLLNPATCELGHFDSATGKESLMERQRGIEVIHVSPKLMEILLVEFNQIAMIERQNREIRKSPEGIFRFTAIQAPTYDHPELYAAAIHRIGRLPRF